MHDASGNSSSRGERVVAGSIRLRRGVVGGFFLVALAVLWSLTRDVAIPTGEAFSFAPPALGESDWTALPKIELSEEWSLGPAYNMRTEDLDASSREVSLRSAEIEVIQGIVTLAPRVPLAPEDADLDQIFRVLKTRFRCHVREGDPRWREDLHALFRMAQFERSHTSAYELFLLSNDHFADACHELVGLIRTGHLDRELASLRDFYRSGFYSGGQHEWREFIVHEYQDWREQVEEYHRQQPSRFKLGRVLLFGEEWCERVRSLNPLSEDVLAGARFRPWQRWAYGKQTHEIAESLPDFIIGMALDWGEVRGSVLAVELASAIRQFEISFGSLPAAIEDLALPNGYVEKLRSEGISLYWSGGSLNVGVDSPRHDRWLGGFNWYFPCPFTAN